MVYDDLIVIDGKDSKFDDSDFNKFVVAWTLLTNKKLPSDTLRSFTSKVNCKSVRRLDEINEFINDKTPDWVGISSIDKNTSKKIYNFI